MKFEQIRAQHRRFIYRRYTMMQVDNTLLIRFTFTIDPDIVFTPEIRIPWWNDVVPAGQPATDAIPLAVLNNLAFHLGLAEIPSYWKTTCAPEILIEAGPLDAWQRDWWQNLLLNGMTEFYAVNGIDFTKPDFVTIHSAAPTYASHPIPPPPGASHPPGPPLGRDERRLNTDRVLVPIGGGKDSIVTIETLRKHAPAAIGCLLLNPMQAARDIVDVAGCQSPLIVSRTIDPTLLQLNERGYLNGHTPFSSLISFVSAACALLFGYGRVAVSYERSSNEGNTIRYGREINHQYSKTFDFEQRFRAYVAAYLSPTLEFFSFLRPLYELQITRIFSRHNDYHPVFRSCNRGLNTNSWCGQCPKCLFVYIALFPFLPPSDIQAIFSDDLFAHEELAPLALQLLDPAGQKPFECVGTREESLVAFALCVQQVRNRGQPLPPLLRIIESRFLQHQPNLENRATALLASWNEQHAIPPELAPWLRRDLEMGGA
jgi:hypothetical protein